MAVVGAKGCAGQFLYEVVLFAGAPTGADEPESIGPMAVLDAQQSTSGHVHGVVPRCGMQLPVFSANERLSEAIPVMDELVAEAALHAQVSVVDRGSGWRRGDPHYLVVLHVADELASDTAAVACAQADLMKQLEPAAARARLAGPASVRSCAADSLRQLPCATLREAAPRAPRTTQSARAAPPRRSRR